MTLNTSHIHGGLPQVARAEEEKAFYCLYPIKCATRCQGDQVIVGTTPQRVVHSDCA